MISRKYGWKPELPDFRDFKFKNTFSVSNLDNLPKSINLQEYCSKVENQGSLGSCTANAIVGNLEFLSIKNNLNFEDLSRLFIYYNERLLEGTINEDSGAYIRDGIKSLVKFGVCNESVWPYSISKFKDKPTDEIYNTAKNNVISSYYRLNSLEEKLKCLADGYPFIFGFTVYNYFESAEMSTTGILKMPTNDERPLGGHAVLAIGYDMNTKMILVRNSWGNAWGLNGYFWMPFDYINNYNLSDDFWTIRK